MGNWNRHALNPDRETNYTLRCSCIQEFPPPHCKSREMAPALLGFSFVSPFEKPKAKNDVNEAAEDNKEDELRELRLINERLLQELQESRRQEAELRAEVEETKIRLLTVREAEERLCTQLGEFEAESVERAQAYNQEIISLTQRLNHAEHLLSAANDEIQRRR